MRVVVDTNILFSALLNSNHEIAGIIRAQRTACRFYMSDFTLVELNAHRGKIKRLSGQTDEELNELMQRFFQYMEIIGSGVISKESWNQASRWVADIDPDDVVFVALTLFLDAYLWTGDKVLHTGLQSKGFQRVLLTPALRILTENK
jgi:predicted nucleic acid-binding protein